MESTEQEGPLARDASGFAISLQDLNSPCEITQHWLDAVEQSRFEAESRFTRSEESEHLRKSYEYLDFQKTEILKFLEKIESNSMEQLLDDLLNYRIHYIKPITPTRSGSLNMNRSKRIDVTFLPVKQV